MRYKADTASLAGFAVRPLTLARCAGRCRIRAAVRERRCGGSIGPRCPEAGLHRERAESLYLVMLGRTYGNLPRLSGMVTVDRRDVRSDCLAGIRRLAGERRYGK